MLTELGDEPRAEAIAAAIKLGCPTRTGELVNIVLRAYGLKSYKKRSARDQHPAARVFQALRMAVNREVANLEHLLRTLPYLLNPGGRAAFITFHSGEQKRVHDALLSGLKAGLYSGVDIDGTRPTGDEIHNNPRARSARLLSATRA